MRVNVATLPSSKDASTYPLDDNDNDDDDDGDDDDKKRAVLRVLKLLLLEERCFGSGILEMVLNMMIFPACKIFF